jgi:hypothetical protein
LFFLLLGSGNRMSAHGAGGSFGADHLAALRTGNKSHDTL